MKVKSIEDLEEFNQIALSLALDYEAIYLVDIETGNYSEFSPSENYSSMNVPSKGEDFYKETRENAERFAHPDDREFAVSLYYKDKILESLGGKKSVSYKYRIMVHGEPRYYRFTVIIADDRKHFVVCVKDIDDEITAEQMRAEKQKKVATFSQIAETLASNYDVIYYVNVRNGHYIGYTVNPIYGNIEDNERGEDFFADCKANLDLVVHPQDRQMLENLLMKENLMTALSGKKQISLDYRIIYKDTPKHTRLSVRRTSDMVHYIICVENIDMEIKKEREHQRALNTEKELARLDALTGAKNKTAYIELENAVQTNIDNGMDYLPFALAVCDINGLKDMNDHNGHHAGDGLIKATYELIKSVFVNSPVFRIGGDEFAVFVRGDDYVNREILLKNITDKVLDNLKRKSGPVVAVGLSSYNPGKDTEVVEIFERADELMYKNKRELKGLAL